MLSFVLKRWRSILLLAAMWLVFECWISWAAFCDQVKEHGGSYQPAEEYRCIFRGPVISTGRFFVGWWDHIFDKADAYVALFTAVLVVATAAIYLAGEKQWRLSKDTAERQLRAYVNPDTRVVSARFAIRNFGQTPAHGVHHAARVEVLPFPVTKSPFLDFPVDIEAGEQKSKILTAPNMWFWGSGIADREFSFAEQSTILDQESPRFCCFGYIRYDDIFGHTRKTKFCYSVARGVGNDIAVHYAPIDNEGD